MVMNEPDNSLGFLLLAADSAFDERRLLLLTRSANSLV
jgi:hypothetical protein